MSVRTRRWLKIIAMVLILISIYAMKLSWWTHVALAVLSTALAVDACRNLFMFRAQKIETTRVWPPSALQQVWTGFSYPVYRLLAAAVGVSIAVSEVSAALEVFGAPLIYPHEYATLLAGADTIGGLFVPEPDYLGAPLWLVGALTLLNTTIISGGTISVLHAWWRFAFDRTYRWTVLNFQAALPSMTTVTSRLAKAPSVRSR